MTAFGQNICLKFKWYESSVLDDISLSLFNSHIIYYVARLFEIFDFPNANQAHKSTQRFDRNKKSRVFVFFYKDAFSEQN